MQPLPPPPPPPPATPPPPPPAAPPSALPAHATTPPAAVPPPDPYPDTTLFIRVLRWIRAQFGIRALMNSRARAILLFFLVTSPMVTLKLAVIPFLASKSVDAMAESYGVDLSVGSWSADVSDLSATAEDITLRVSGPFEKKELLVADELEVDLSLWSRLRGSTWTRSLTLRDAKLYLERTPSGGWNWEELAARRDTFVVPRAGDGPRVVGYSEAEIAEGEDEREQETAPDFAIPRLEIEGLSLQWVENERGPGGGDGLIREVKSSLYLDDMTVVVDNLIGFVDPRPRASRLLLEARTGSGTLSFSGQGNLFHWVPRSLATEPEAVGPGASPSLVATSASAPVPGREILAWSPSLGAKLSLEGVGAGVLARLTPQATLVPSRGTMSGELVLDVEQDRLRCTADLDLRDVMFTVNRASPLYASSGAQLAQEVASVRADGPRRFDCGGVLDADSFRPFQAFQAQVTRQAVTDAPKLVRAAATVDHARYAETEIEPELRSTVTRLAGDLDPEVVQWIGLAHELGVRPGLPGDQSAPGFLKKVGRFFGR